ncbi:MAG: CHAP domain-containing protein [Chloroflexi bacterium]|nr:CHAP domain-containing protein [Chloroflexota bacterium]
MSSDPQPRVNWQTYQDSEYDFVLEFPVEWEVETTIHQSMPFSDSSAIVKRLSFRGNEGAIDLDLWLANGYNLEEWLTWYMETRRELPVDELNSSVAGQSAVVFVESNVTVDLLTTFFSDGKYVYRLWYTITQNPQGVYVYWHMLDTFTLSRHEASAAEIPKDIKQIAEEAVGISGVEAGNYCCNNYSPYCSLYFTCCNDQGNCTWWVCYRFGVVPFRGDAVTWWGQVPDYPDWTRHTAAPKQNQENIAYWSAGHVAYIANYTGGPNVNITEMSNCASCFNARQISIDDPYGFIYEKYPPPP